MENDYFFSDWQDKRPWVRARGWGDDGKPLYLPNDTLLVENRTVADQCYSLYRSSSQKRWYAIHYDECHSQWHGYALYTISEYGNPKLVRTKSDAASAWDSYLEERSLSARSRKELDSNYF